MATVWYADEPVRSHAPHVARDRVRPPRDHDWYTAPGAIDNGDMSTVAISPPALAAIESTNRDRNPPTLTAWLNVNCVRWGGGEIYFRYPGGYAWSGFGIDFGYDGERAIGGGTWFAVDVRIDGVDGIWQGVRHFNGRLELGSRHRDELRRATESFQLILWIAGDALRWEWPMTAAADVIDAACGTE